MAAVPSVDLEKESTVNEQTPLVSKPGALWWGDTSYLQLVNRRKVVISVCTILLIGYGVVIGVYVEGWSWTTAMYVTMQIVTTIGYGDFTVARDSYKLIMSFYIIACLIFLSYVFQCMAEQFSSMKTKFLVAQLEKFEQMSLANEEEPVTKTETSKKRRLKDAIAGRGDGSYDSTDKLILSTAVAIFFLAFGTIFYGTYERCSCSYGVSLVPGCREDDVDTCIKTGGYVKTWIQSWYMSVVTLTTIGFGDHSPRSEVGRVVGIVWMFFGVGSMAHWLQEMSAWFFREATRGTFTSSSSEADTKALFDEVDSDNSGSLSRSEFRAYMLLKHHVITMDDLKALDSHYALLDTNNQNAVSYEQMDTHHRGVVNSYSARGSPRLSGELGNSKKQSYSQSAPCL